MQHESPTPGRSGPIPCTLQRTLCSLRSKLCILHYTPSTIHFTPYILSPTPYTIYSTPKNLPLTSYTLRSLPQALHPTPYTIQPTPHTPQGPLPNPPPSCNCVLAALSAGLHHHSFQHLPHSTRSTVQHLLSWRTPHTCPTAQIRLQTLNMPPNICPLGRPSFSRAHTPVAESWRMRPSPAISSERKAFSTNGTRVFAAVPITRVKKPSRVPLATDGGVRAALNPKPETRNPKPETRNPKLEIRNRKPEPRNPEP